MLTVIIPVYNREAEIARCLDSVATQTRRPTRIIVVDDGSTDRTANIARAHPAGVEVVNGNHRGAAAARNMGLELVTTPWTMFFDSDDIMEPSHIETAMSMAKDDVDLIGWDINRISLQGEKSVWKFEIKDLPWHNIMHGALATQRYMARTELFRKAGCWNPDVRVWNDIELGARLLSLKPRVAKKTDISVTVFETEQSITGTKWSDKTDRFMVSLDALGKTLNKEHKDWVDLKTAILAADIFREDPESGKKMYERVERKTLPLRLAYFYRRMGGRGAARLLRMFFSK